LPWERRIPKKDDDKGWKDLRVFLIRLSRKVVTPPKLGKLKKPKGIRTLFQLQSLAGVSPFIITMNLPSFLLLLVSLFGDLFGLISTKVF
jgi:hypothetical protein